MADWLRKTAGFTPSVGFGRVAALDPATGKALWEKNLGTPVRAAPTASGDRVFIISMEGRFYCLNGLDGSELWVVRGLPQNSSLVMKVSPAVDGDIVAVPYPSGDLLALNIADGAGRAGRKTCRVAAPCRRWPRCAMRQLRRSQDGVVFAVGHSGRMVATKAATGERIWQTQRAQDAAAMGGWRYRLRGRYRRAADGRRPGPPATPAGR